MRDQIAKYAGKLLADRSALPGHIAFAAHDDVLLSAGHPELARLCEGVLTSLSCLGLAAARPSLPFADFLVRRAGKDTSRIVPR
ncbi:MAG: aldolase, partial [Deltaproteobacteria bacterium]